MSTELLILTITGVIAIITYIVKNCKNSTCWTSDSCISFNMNKNRSSADISEYVKKEDIAKIEEKKEDIIKSTIV